jgi:hypothetical protein
MLLLITLPILASAVPQLTTYASEQSTVYLNRKATSTSDGKQKRLLVASQWLLKEKQEKLSGVPSVAMGRYLTSALSRKV